MFKVTIENDKKEETEYIVYGEREFNCIVSVEQTTILPIPNYYELKDIPSQYPTFKITNLVPIIVLPNQIIKTDNFFKSTDLNLYAGYPLELEEYQALYETYLSQMQNNPIPEFQTHQKIKSDIKYTKVLTQIRNNKRA